MINHSNRRAILEILPKIIQIESYDINLSKEPRVAEKRIEILNSLIGKLNSSDLEVTNSLIRKYTILVSFYQILSIIEHAWRYFVRRRRYLTVCLGS
jgi:hypothetical protein